MSFVDVITPPPTSTAKNSGDPTTVEVTLTMHCAEATAVGSHLIDTTISAQFFTQDGFTQNPRLGYFDSLFAHTDVVHGTIHTGCGFALSKDVAGHVGEPIVMRARIGILAFGGTAYYPFANRPSSEPSGELCQQATGVRVPGRGGGGSVLP